MPGTNWSFSKLGAGTVVFFALVNLYVYRNVRNRPQRQQDQFVRRVPKIPEVRLIASHDRQLSVVIDHPVAQLYGRLHGHMKTCNQRLYFGQPMTLTILHELSPEQTRKNARQPGRPILTNTWIVRDFSLDSSSIWWCDFLR